MPLVCMLQKKGRNQCEQNCIRMKRVPFGTGVGT